MNAKDSRSQGFKIFEIGSNQITTLFKYPFLYSFISITEFLSRAVGYYWIQNWINGLWLSKPWFFAGNLIFRVLKPPVKEVFLSISYSYKYETFRSGDVC